MSTAWSYVKRYWSIALLVVGVIAGMFFFRKEQTGFADNLAKLKAAHDEELRAIEDARLRERQEHEANLKRLETTLAAVQVHYDEAKRELDTKKKKEIEAIVDQYSDDPVALAKKLSEATGFVVVLPG